MALLVITVASLVALLVTRSAVWAFSAATALHGAVVARILVASWVPEWIPVPLVAVAPAIVNSMAKELGWRGWLLIELDRRGGPALAVVTTAVSFGLLHFFGLPYGAAGVGLAVAFGLAAGALTG